MPIKPENKDRYPDNWAKIRSDILTRANNKCEVCGINNYTLYKNKKGKICKVVLTISHLDHTPENNDYSNLKAMCQKCHLAYDLKHHLETRKNAEKIIKCKRG